MEEFLKTTAGKITGIQPTLSICIAVFALVVALRNYRRKSGLAIRSTYTLATSNQCDEKYVSEITLANLKDRAVCIFAIYIRLGYHCYIKLEEFYGEPLVLKSYEVIRRGYTSLEFYSCNFSKVKLGEMTNHPCRISIVLSTSEGKYVVPNTLPWWAPWMEQNRHAHVISLYPVRLNRDGIEIGHKTRYLVEILQDDGRERKIAINESGQSLEEFVKFDIPIEELSTSRNFAEFLQARKDAGDWDCRKFNVVDVDELRSGISNLYGQEWYHVVKIGWWKHFVSGWLSACKENRQFRRAMRDLAKDAREADGASFYCSLRSRDQGYYGQE